MTIDPQELRRVMGHFATGVTVITTRDRNGVPFGLTCNAFLSLSLSPPLVLISVDKAAQCHFCFAESRVFNVNVLSEHQEEISRRFATKGADKFAGIAWRPGKNGAALIDGSMAHIQCKLVASHDGGDHTILVGEIIETDTSDGRPLLFFGGRYQRLAGD